MTPKERRARYGVGSAGFAAGALAVAMLFDEEPAKTKTDQVVVKPDDDSSKFLQYLKKAFVGAPVLSGDRLQDLELITQLRDDPTADVGLRLYNQGMPFEGACSGLTGGAETVDSDLLSGYIGLSVRTGDPVSKKCFDTVINEYDTYPICNVEIIFSTAADVSKTAKYEVGLTDEFDLQIDRQAYQSDDKVFDSTHGVLKVLNHGAIPVSDDDTFYWFHLGLDVSDDASEISFVSGPAPLIFKRGIEGQNTWSSTTTDEVKNGMEYVLSLIVVENPFFRLQSDRFLLPFYDANIANSSHTVEEREADLTEFCLKALIARQRFLLNAKPWDAYYASFASLPSDVRTLK